MIFGKIKKTMEKNNKLNSPISDPEIIEKLLPHRKPMIMVDRLHFFSEKKAISKLTIVKENIFVTNGYFSETGLLEHMAQTAALHIGYKQFLNCSNHGFHKFSMPKARIFTNFSTNKKQVLSIF